MKELIQESALGRRPRRATAATAGLVVIAAVAAGCSSSGSKSPQASATPEKSAAPSLFTQRIQDFGRSVLELHSQSETGKAKQVPQKPSNSWSASVVMRNGNRLSLRTTYNGSPTLHPAAADLSAVSLRIASGQDGRTVFGETIKTFGNNDWAVAFVGPNVPRDNIHVTALPDRQAATAVDEFGTALVVLKTDQEAAQAASLQPPVFAEHN